MRIWDSPIRKRAFRAFRPAVLAAMASGVLFAAGGSGQTDRREPALKPEQKAAVVRRVAAEFRARYVFADVGQKMAAMVEDRFAEGAYDGLATLTPLAARLQEDLFSVSRDRHVKVMAGMVPEFDEDPLVLRRENYGFTAVEVLPGNIGYLDFFQFYAVKDAGPTAIAAMNFLAHCEALIIDLRSNGGGYPELRSLLASYLFDRPTALIEFRARDGVTQDWTLPYVPGSRMARVPVYVLTGRPTFSCAEDFAFCLQSLGRATIIGENTRGGAHDSKMFSYPEENITLQIPFNEAVDPRTKKTWEGVGIKPDIEVPAAQAFPTAVREAARALLKEEKDAGRRFLLDWIIQDAAAQLNPLELDAEMLQAYVGRYGNYRISLKNGELVLVISEKSVLRLVPVSPDDFKMLAGERHDYATNRLLFARDDGGRVVGLLVHNHDAVRFPVKPRG